MESMESTERAYYRALFRRDYRQAQRLYRILACTDLWSPDRLMREAHKCGIYDEASHDDADVVEVTEILQINRVLADVGMELVTAG